LDKDKLIYTAKLLAPYIAEELMRTPSYWGDSSRVHLGAMVAVNNAHFNLSSGEVYIDDHSFFGNNVCLITGTHQIQERRVGRYKYPTSGRDIHIGKGVWVGTNATILGPCRIGDDAVIAAGAVVLPGEYEGGKIYGGVPARAVKDIDFDDQR